MKLFLYHSDCNQNAFIAPCNSRTFAFACKTNRMGQAHAHNTRTPTGPPTHTHTQLHTLSRVGLLSRNTCWILQQLLCWSDCLRLFSCLLDIGLTWPEVLPICISIARAHTIDNLAGPAAVANFGNLFEPMCVRQQQAELCDSAVAQFICHELVACLCLQFRRT